MSKSTANVFKTYSNRSNARRAAATAKLAEGTFELNTLEGGKCELKEVKAKPVSRPYGFSSHGLTHCPHCKIDLENGVGEHNQDVNGKKIKHKKFEFECLGCGGEFGPEIAPARAKASKPAAAAQGLYKIEAKREVRNGIKRHSAGTTCDNLWKLFESMAANLKGGIKDLTCAAAKEAAAKKGFDMTTTTIQFYAWRRFSGVRGRVVLKKAL